MSFFTDHLFVSAPKELDYLLKTYCKETAYLTMDDLKQRHKSYLFNIVRVIRRCMETQLLNINNAGAWTYTLCNQMLTLCLEYYKGVDAVTSADDLKEACRKFIDDYKELADTLRDTTEARTYLLDSDLHSRAIPNIAWQQLAQKVNPYFTVKGHHVNVLVPYPQEDLAYIRNFSSILRYLFNEPQRQYYSFYRAELDSSLFTSGMYLHTTKERTNMKQHSFDAVVVTHDNMFNDIRPRINAAANYVKKNGAVILTGLTTDFKRLDLQRISAILQDIHVYFQPVTANIILHDYELCLIVGRIKDTQAPSELTKLLTIFTNHEENEDKAFTFYGSGQDEKPPFSSYDITEAEAIALIPDVRNTTKRFLANLLPKTTADTRRPLLPFSSGQLGLILISGDINGTIQEKDTNCRHIVKGSSKQRRDVKTQVLATDDHGQATRIQRTESVYSSTNVNVILPTGSLRELC